MPLSTAALTETFPAVSRAAVAGCVADQRISSPDSAADLHKYSVDKGENVNSIVASIFTANHFSWLMSPGCKIEQI